MISTVEEYNALLDSTDAEARFRARHDPLADHLWGDILRNHPDLWESVALHKATPRTILHELAKRGDSDVRHSVRNA